MQSVGGKFNVPRMDFLLLEERGFCSDSCLALRVPTIFETFRFHCIDAGRIFLVKKSFGKLFGGYIDIHCFTTHFTDGGNALLCW